MRKREKTTKKYRWLIPAMVLFVFAAAFLLYTANYYRADSVAAASLKSDNVKVEQTSYGWFFDGPSDTTALIFYPGAKVEETAYAPLLHRLAEAGIDVCLAKMPFHLALFGENIATDIIRQYDYDSWYIGGHSLGGVIAERYASAHDLSGVILLAAYPIKEAEEPMMIIYGSRDGILDMEKVNGADQFGTVEKMLLEGGNHAQFGNYGFQKGDAAAEISAEEQQLRTVDIIKAWIQVNTE